VGGRHLPVSSGRADAQVRRIATEIGVTGFKGSPYLILTRAARHNLHIAALWGQGGSADVAGAATRISKILSELEVDPVERICTTNEPGILFRCIPYRA